MNYSINGKKKKYRAEPILKAVDKKSYFKKMYKSRKEVGRFFYKNLDFLLLLKIQFTQD